jgi:hypothetical protein
MMYPVIATLLFRSGARWLLFNLFASAGMLALELAYVAHRISRRAVPPPTRRFL